MQAIILAAGMGKRLKSLTEHNTKCMVEVNGVTLIERMLRQLEEVHLSRIVIVVGYQGQKLIDFVSDLNIQTPIVYVNNPIYDKTNNIYSLALVKDHLCQEDTLLLESDIIFEDSVLETILHDSRDTLALVDKYESWMDGTCVKLGEDDSIEAFVSGKQLKFEEVDEYYKTVNIYKFSRHFSKKCYVPFLVAYQEALGDNEYYEQVLRVITILDNPEIKVKRLSGQIWYEIDDIQDLDIASSMFAVDDAQKLSLMQQRYGGYWRYPRVLDFCYLVNPYFPPQKMMDEIKASFDILLTQYPSGRRVNALLAGKNFGVREEHILVGNGAAELIKALMEQLPGRIGMVCPTFEEYPNRCQKENILAFTPDNDDYSYTAKDLTDYFGDKDIETLLLINPDNPSGNYIPHGDMMKLVEWAKGKQLHLIVDESFVDFADESERTLIEQKILEENPHLYVMKSISKSYGVPGLRLGVLASGNTSMIARLKKDVAIWNINSFAEFYMQIMEKYTGDYEAALGFSRKERARLQDKLGEMPHFRVIPSQANYIMVELMNGVSSRELTQNLLVKHGIFVKDLSVKLCGKNYLRLAVRNREDNDKLLWALEQELGKG